MVGQGAHSSDNSSSKLWISAEKSASSQPSTVWSNSHWRSSSFRATCLIYLDAWRYDQPLAEQWLLALQGLLSAEEQPVRRQAAESLVQLPTSKDDRRLEWFKTTLEVIRGRLAVEADESVLKALVKRLDSIVDQFVELFGFLTGSVGFLSPCCQII